MLNVMQQLHHPQNVQQLLYKPLRLFHLSKLVNNKKLEFMEVKIPVPWGHIAGKWWGSPDVQPMLALHGVQDNAATFDKLIPLLHVDAVLALDLPGHGLSSHIPRGFLYDYLDAVCVVRFVIHHYYKWKKPILLLGHSFGSALSFMYSATFPKQVSKYISIDCARHQMAVLPYAEAKELKTTMDKTLDYEEKGNPPEYTYEELLEKLYHGRKGRISKESCELLLSRGMSTLNNGKVCLSRDVRIKLNAVGRLTLDNLLTFAPRIKCDVLSIQAENGTVKNDIKGETYTKTVEIMLKNSQNSKHLIMAGNHHLHLDNPVPVADEINKFILR